MRLKVKLWGNSLAVRIPKYIARQIKINNGSNVNMLLEKEKIIITPIKESQELLDDLLSRITDDNIHREVDFGTPTGDELW